MINERIKLVAPRRMEIFFEDEKITEDSVIVRPRYLSICAADQRYYTGSRSKEILDKKLPLSLIHEAVGEVLYDPKNEFKKGDRVVLIPNLPFEKNEIIKENYLRSSKFRASSHDGFLQNVVVMRRDRIIDIKNIDLNVKIGTEDAGITAILVGIFAGILGIIIKKPKYQILPIYANRNLLKINLNGIFTIYLMHYIYKFIKDNIKGRFMDKSLNKNLNFKVR